MGKLNDLKIPANGDGANGAGGEPGAASEDDVDAGVAARDVDPGGGAADDIGAGGAAADVDVGGGKDEITDFKTN